LPPSLSVRIHREFFFSVILKSEETLGQFLGKSVSQSLYTLPPSVKKHNQDIEGQFLGAGFSGAYVSNKKDEYSPNELLAAMIELASKTESEES
jgi:hypothetical protein